MNTYRGCIVNNMQKLASYPSKLQVLKQKPTVLYYLGNTQLLHKPIVAIVGSRKPGQYTKQITYKLANELAKRDVVVISGGAMGVDAMAHKGASAANTIAVVANGLDIRYPKVNEGLIKEIEEKGLVLSGFEKGFRATKWSFPKRNELVIALADAVVITQADLKSGSMISAKLAKKYEKKLYVIPHRIGESQGTNQLVQNDEAKPIYDIEQFADTFGKVESDKTNSDTFLHSYPSYEEAVAKYGSKIFEYELEGKIEIKEGRVYLK